MDDFPTVRWHLTAMLSGVNNATFAVAIPIPRLTGFLSGLVYGIVIHARQVARNAGAIELGWSSGLLVRIEGSGNAV